MHHKELHPGKDRDKERHWHIMSHSNCCLVADSSTHIANLLGKSVFVDSGKPCMLITAMHSPGATPAPHGCTEPSRCLHQHRGLPAKHSLSGGAPCSLGLGQPKTIPLEGNTISTSAMHCMLNAEEQPGLLLTWAPWNRKALIQLRA